MTVRDMLAAYRIVRLLQTDTVTEQLRARYLAWCRVHAPRLADLAWCPWCLSVWVAAGILLARRRTPRVWSVIAEVLAMSAVASVAAVTVEAVAEGGA